MFEESLRITNLLHIEHDDFRGFLGIESFVKMFKDILNTKLGRVADSPHAVEGKSIADAILFDKHGGGTRSGDKVDTMRVKFRDRCVKTTRIVSVEETCAVGTDKRTAYGIDAVDNMFLYFGTLLILLGETCGNNDETFGTLLLCKHIYGTWTEFRCYAENRTVDLWKILNRGIAFHSLDFSLFGVDGVDIAFKIAGE